MNRNEIPIENIEVLQNTRTELGDLSELMTSIRENGLLEPIGVWNENGKYIVAYGHRRFAAMQKLGRKTLVVGREVIIYPKPLNQVDFLVLNITENLHRSDNTPVELGRACKMLREAGLSVSEIASRLSINPTRVDNAISIISRVPKEFQKDVGYFKLPTDSKKGKISSTIAARIANSRLKKAEMEEIFKSVKENELSLKDVELVNRMVQVGSTVKQAVKAKEKYFTTQLALVIDKDEFAKLNTSLVKYVRSVLKGEEKPNPKLLY